MANPLKYHFWRKHAKFCHYVRNVVMNILTFPVNLKTTSGLLILLHGVISLPDATTYDNSFFVYFFQGYCL